MPDATPKQPVREIETPFGPAQIIDWRNHETEFETRPTLARIKFDKVVINNKEYADVYFDLTGNPRDETRWFESRSYRGGLTESANRKVHEWLDTIPEAATYAAPLAGEDVIASRKDLTYRGLTERIWKTTREVMGVTEDEILEVLKGIVAEKEAGRSFQKQYFGR